MMITMKRRALPWHSNLRAACLLIATSVMLPLSPSHAAAPVDDTLVIARSMDVNALDPARAFCDTCQIVLSSLYDTVVMLSPDNKSIVAGLAKSWDINQNQTVFTFHLDPLATFADGKPVEAKDVKWSWERLKNLKESPSFLMDGVSAIDTPDKETVIVSLAAPNAEFLNKLTATYTGIINSTVATAAGANVDQSDKADNWFLNHSAGSGPYKLVEYKPNDEIRMARNEGYWRKKAAFSSVVIRQAQDAVQQSQMLQSGDADIAMQVDFDTAKSIGSDTITTQIVPSYNFLYLGLGVGAKSNSVPLTLSVREAISLAIDYDGLIDFTVGSEGKKQSSPIPNGFPGTTGLPPRQQDLDKAKALLKQAKLADGFTLDAVYPADNVYGVDINVMMQKVQQDLARVNIKLALKPVTYPVWRAQLGGDGIPMTAVYYAPDYYGSGQYVNYFGMVPGSSWSKRAGATNKSDIINPKESELLSKALASPADEQDKLFHALGMEMMKDNVIIPLVSPNLVLAFRSDIRGMRYSASANLPISELSRGK